MNVNLDPAVTFLLRSLAFSGAVVLLGAMSFSHDACAADAPKPVEPVTVLEWTAADGTQRIGDRHSLNYSKVDSSAAKEAFLALPSEDWRNGFVPIFAVERTGRFELRRRPPQGEENLLEPIFMALPLVGEPSTAQIAGSWRCTATRSSGSDAWFVWQLTVEGDVVAGRFDPGSDYRVAYLKGGTFHTNRLELIVEYSNETYQLFGELRGEKLVGRWEKGDREERGQWEATRVELPPHRTPAGEPVPLREWRRESDDARHYTLSTNSPGRGWKLSEQPLCRVWPIRQPATSPK